MRLFLPLPLIICFLLITFSTASFQRAYANIGSPLPLEYFASLPDTDSIRLSPNGAYVAAFVRITGKDRNGKAVYLIDVNNGKSDFLVYAEDKEFDLRSFRWANNEKLLVHAAFPEVRNGVRTMESRLLIVDIKTKKNRNVFTKNAVRKLGVFPQIQDHIIDMLPNDPNHFLLAVREASTGYRSVYKVSLDKLRFRLVQKSKKGAIDWFADRRGDVRIGVTRDDTTYRILHKPVGEKKWVTLWEYEAFSRETVWPMGFGENKNHLYVTALHEGRDAVFRVDLAKPDLPRVLVYANEYYDVAGSLVYSKRAKSVVGLSTSIDEHIFWDDSLLALHGGLNKAMPDTSNYIVSMSDDERRYILFSTSSSEPGAYYLGDRDKKTLTIISERYANLSKISLPNKNRISYKARDGLNIEAYLTFPKGKERANLPVIIFPHGGPISFDGSEFDYWTQFFANRGYAVLQMNFRGSSGYGHDFMQAGLQGWGKAMQDDVEDGVHWLLEQGYADKNNICIVGASYGGYAALMAAVRNPDLYQCVVSFAGVSDLPKLVKSHRSYTNYDIVKAQVGSDFKDMKLRSPYYHAEEISVPVLLIHGEKDRVVNIRQRKKCIKRCAKPSKMSHF